MKEKMKLKMSAVITKIFGISTFILLFAGGLTAFGYIAAFVIGGDTGMNLTVFLHKKVFKVLIYASSLTVILGWWKMELAGERVMTSRSR